MAASLADRYRLGELPSFQTRVQGALEQVCNEVGDAAGARSETADKRLTLIRQILSDPVRVSSQFARAAAGWNPTTPATDMGDTFADTAGADDVKQAAITDTIIVAYCRGAFDIIAGVRPGERT
jgi:hypothetical protein